LCPKFVMDMFQSGETLFFAFFASLREIISRKAAEFAKKT